MKFTSIKAKILIIAIVAALVLSLNFFRAETKGFFYYISTPIQKVFWSVGDSIANFFGAVGDLNGLREENDQLQGFFHELLAEKAYLTELKEENEVLREALQLDLQKEFQLVLVDVIGKDIGQDSFLINQGSRDGLSPGMPVITQQKILVGRIAEVFEKFSRVVLISNKNSSFDAKVSGTAITGVARGQGGSNLKFDLVPQEKELKADDLVVSSALGGIYPEGLLVGRISKASRDDVSSFYQSEIAPLFNLESTTMVFVIINFDND